MIGIVYIVIVFEILSIVFVFTVVTTYVFVIELPFDIHTFS